MVAWTVARRTMCGSTAMRTSINSRGLVISAMSGFSASWLKVTNVPLPARRETRLLSQSWRRAARMVVLEHEKYEREGEPAIEFATFGTSAASKIRETKLDLFDASYRAAATDQ